MKILSIHIKNIHSLRQEVHLDFGLPPLSETGIFAITGPTGAGKTTILDALTLALYGRVARMDAKEIKQVVSYGATECLAEVVFSISGQRYMAGWRMHRARGKVDGALQGPYRELSEWNEEQQHFVPLSEKIRDMDEKVEALTGLDYARFCRSVLLAQGDFAAFLKANEKERSELLERITGTAIYSDLSKAAFDRHKLEKQTLEDLQSRLNQLQTLHGERPDEAQLDKLRQDAAHTQQQMNIVREQLNAYSAYHGAVAKQQELALAQAQLQQDEAAFQPQLEALHNNAKLAPFLADIAKLETLQAGVAPLEQEIISLEEDVRQLQTRQQQLGEQVDQATQNQRTLKDAHAQQAVSLQKAEAIEQNLRLLEQENAAKTQQLAELNAELRAKEQAVEQAKTLLHTARQNQAENENWLNKHIQFAELTQQLPLIKATREQLRKDYQRHEEKAKELEQVNQKQAQNARELQDRQQQLDVLQQQQKQLQAALNQLLPQHLQAEGQPTLQLLDQAIHDSSQQQIILSKLAVLWDNYWQTLQEVSTLKDSLDALYASQNLLHSRLLSAIEQKELADKHLHFKRNVFEQQQRIANYAKDRQTLQPGEPCPLCFSTHHPFHDHDVTPFVDEALADLRKAEKASEHWRKEEAGILRQESELFQKITLLLGEEDTNEIGQLQKQALKLAEMEQDIATVRQAHDADFGPLSTEHWHEQERRLKAQIDDLKQKRQEAANTAQLLEQTSNDRQQSQSEVLVLQARAQALEEERLQTEQEWQQARADFTATEAQINEHLSTFGLKFGMETAKAMFAKLEETAITYTQNRQQADTARQQAHEQEQFINQWLPEVQKMQAKKADLELQCQQVESQQQQLRQEYHALVGTQSVADIRAAQQVAIDEAATALQNAQSTWQAHREEQSARQELLKEKKKDAAKLLSQLTSLRNSLEQQLTLAGWNSLETAISDRLELGQKNQWEAALKQLEKQRAELEHNQKAVAATLNEYAHAADFDKTALQIRAQELQTQYDTLQRETGHLTALLEQHQRLEQEQASLLQQIQQQSAEHQRWHALNELIGSADGKKFRTFAQGLTLQRLVHTANLHLEKLSGRYHIIKRNDNSLDLEIIDTFQADNRRSMFTLSGGESFLVSLALALGLSELAGKKAQIESLFIDEGFGTLDEHSLDMALDTLENLQSTGKTIGVISHVKAMQERIGVQIRVVKHSTGFSHVEVVRG